MKLPFVKRSNSVSNGFLNEKSGIGGQGFGLSAGAMREMV
jgi:hypothetical protein